MIIDDKQVRVSILILFMDSEVDVTLQTVETLLPCLPTDVTISLLANGTTRPDLRQKFANCPPLHYYESPSNLGVAGGRNFLLDTAECKNSDIVIVLDNDVIPTTDYVQRLCRFLLAHDDAGIVGATVLNMHTFFMAHESAFGRSSKGPFGGKIFQVDSSTLKKTLVEDLVPSYFYHIGSNVDWYNAYFSSEELFEEIAVFLGIRPKKDFYCALVEDERFVDIFRTDTHCIQVSNVIGCTQTYHRRLVEEIGGYNDLFNPYGYEDVDFSIRAMHAGHRNYVDTNTLLVHGTDMRHKDRVVFQRAQRRRNNARCLTLLHYNHFRQGFRELAKRRILFTFLLESLKKTHRAYERLYYEVQGYHHALRQIECVERDAEGSSAARTPHESGSK